MRSAHESGFKHSTIFPVAELILLAAIFTADALGFVPLSKTPLIVALASVSLAIRKLKWKDVGFQRPENWKSTVLWGVVLGFAASVFSLVFTQPILKAVSGETPNLELLASIEGNLKMLFVFLGLNWILAAFGEEMSYRGYVLNRVLDYFGGSKTKEWLTVVIVGTLFGFAHFSQGLIGMIENSVNGILFGALFLASGRNLWLMVILHGVSNTVDMVMIYFGNYPGVH